MKLIKKLLELLQREQGFIKNIFLIIFVTRLLFLEPNQLALIAEILVTLTVILSENYKKKEEKEYYDDEDDI
jgi:hypothetical protein